VVAKYLTVVFIGRCLPILNIFERSD